MKGGTMRCIFINCSGHEDALQVLIHGQQHLAAELATIRTAIAAVNTKAGKTMTDVATLTADFNTYKGDVSAAFARLQASLDAALANQGIPADVQAQIDALDTAIHGADDEANAEDPATPVA
jgi:hypothetical protein